MFENKELAELLQQIKVMNYLLQDVLRILRNIDDNMPRCTCNDEHAVGDTWKCVFHGAVTKTTL